MTDKVQWALNLAEKGLAVFPLVHTLEDGSCSCGDSECRLKNRGKHPKPGSHGYKDAMKDKVAIFDAWDRDEDANIGVYPGTDHVWVDLDTKNKDNGIVSLAEKLGIPVEEVSKLTFSVETPTGGLHLYFRTAVPVSDRVNVLPGVDIRGAGGYVVGPGSTIGERAYRVINDAPIVEIPDKLRDILGRVREKSENQTPMFDWDLPEAIDMARYMLKSRKPAIEGEGGNAHTYATACLVRSYAISEETCLEILLEPDGWNDRCEPPWDADELAKVVENAYRYAKDRPGARGGAVMELADIQYEGEYIHVRSKSGSSEADEWTGDTDSDADEFADYRDSFHMGNDFSKLQRDFKFIVPNWIPAQGYTGILASRGIGKTTMIIDIVARLASDMDWYDVPMDKGWSVVYIVGEDVEGVQQRLLAWFKRYNDGEPFVDQSRFCVLEMPVDLTDPKEVKRFARFLNQFYKAKQAKETEEEGEPRKTVFVIDTWQTATLRAERGMNDDAAMSLAAAHVVQLSKLFHGPSLISFHPPKTNPHSVAGSSVVENMSTAIIKLEQDGDEIRTAVVTRLKGGKTGEYFKMKLDAEVLEGKIDQFGRPVTGAVVTKIGGSTMQDTQELQDMDIELGRLIAEIIENASAFPGLLEISKSAIAKQILDLPVLAREDSKSLIFDRLLGAAQKLQINFDSDFSTLTRHIGRRVFKMGTPQATDEVDLKDNKGRWLIQERKNEKKTLLSVKIKSALMERAEEEEEDTLE